jgi:hypothetical protein
MQRDDLVAIFDRGELALNLIALDFKPFDRSCERGPDEIFKRVVDRCRLQKIGLGFRRSNPEGSLFAFTDAFY